MGLALVGGLLGLSRPSSAPLREGTGPRRSWPCGEGTSAGKGTFLPGEAAPQGTCPPPHQLPSLGRCTPLQKGAFYWDQRSLMHARGLPRHPTLHSFRPGTQAHFLGSGRGVVARGPAQNTPHPREHSWAPGPHLLPFHAGPGAGNGWNSKEGQGGPHKGPQASHLS